MKRLILLAFLSLVAVAQVYAAEIYWDTPPGDAEITDKDFKYKYDGATPAKSFRELDVYFNPGDPPPDWAAPLYESDQPVAAAVQSDITETASTTSDNTAPQHRTPAHAHYYASSRGNEPRKNSINSATTSGAPGPDREEKKKKPA